MLGELWNAIVEYFKQKPYWSRLQPAFILAFLYAGTIVTVYQYLHWQYQITPSPGLFFRSYILKQITIVFIAVAVVLYVARERVTGERRIDRARLLAFAREHGWALVWKGLIVLLVLGAATVLFYRQSPHRNIGHIRIKFMGQPDFNKDAFVYLMYELNRVQKNWYFEVDFKPFSETMLRSEARERCAEDPHTALCQGEDYAKGEPFIFITPKSLGEDYFWDHRHNVSVISTDRWQDYAPPSTYEYLAYCVVVQSIWIHLDLQCGGISERPSEETGSVHGDLFEYLPRREAMKAAILVAHLSPKGEDLLFNCFGAQYTSRCASLLSLEWLRDKRVSENLDKVYGATNQSGPRSQQRDTYKSEKSLSSAPTP